MFIPQIIKKSQIKIPAEFEWILLIFVVFTLFLGKISGIIVPIFFGIAIAMIGFMILAILYSNNQIKKDYFLIILFTFSFTITFGFLLELLKYYLKNDAEREAVKIKSMRRARNEHTYYHRHKIILECLE